MSEARVEVELTMIVTDPDGTQRVIHVPAEIAPPPPVPSE